MNFVWGKYEIYLYFSSVPHVFPLSRIDDLLDRNPGGVQHNSIFDAAHACWTLELDE